MMNSLLLVGAGGAAGSMIRFLLQRYINTSHYPFGTLAANVGGCLLIGILMGLLAKDLITEQNFLIYYHGELFFVGAKPLGRICRIYFFKCWFRIVGHLCRV